MLVILEGITGLERYPKGGVERRRSSERGELFLSAGGRRVIHGIHARTVSRDLYSFPLFSSIPIFIAALRRNDSDARQTFLLVALKMNYTLKAPRTPALLPSTRDADIISRPRLIRLDEGINKTNDIYHASLCSVLFGFVVSSSLNGMRFSAKGITGVTNFPASIERISL